MANIPEDLITSLLSILSPGVGSSRPGGDRDSGRKKATILGGQSGQTDTSGLGGILELLTLFLRPEGRIDSFDTFAEGDKKMATQRQGLLDFFLEAVRQRSN